MNYIITVDGGTSNTRTYLWTTDGKILTHRSQAIGAKTSAINGSNQPWKQAIHDIKYADRTRHFRRFCPGCLYVRNADERPWHP